ncbi:MAG TPA: nuclear transport factor 2 family protein [Solirubrobacterales bacterium]|nr:nuclear transport factor 2 family protein [Solirubrobacterales bacterium]
MSEGNVEVVRAALDAYNRGDLEAMMKHAAPDLEFDWSRSISPQKGVYNRDQFPDFTLAGEFESVRTEPEELIDAGGHVITPLIGYFQGRDGIELTARFTYLWTFRDGVCVRVTIFQTRDEALEAAGLRE